jgi:hypothetical protein
MKLSKIAYVRKENLKRTTQPYRHLEELNFYFVDCSGEKVLSFLEARLYIGKTQWRFVASDSPLKGTKMGKVV